MNRKKSKNRRKLLLIYKDCFEKISIEGSIDENEYILNYATGTDEGITLAYSTCPDLILLSGCFGEAECVDFIKAIRGWSSCSIIIFSDGMETGCISRLLKNGADNIIAMSDDGDYINAVFHACLRRSMVRGGFKPYKSGELYIDFEKRQIFKSGVEIHMSPVEYRIIECLAVNSGTVVTYHKLLNRIWGPYMEEDSKILRVNMANIRKKLENDASIPEYIFTIPRVGYRMAENENTTMIKCYNCKAAV